MALGCLGHAMSSKHIVSHYFKRIALRNGHVFESCGVVNDLRSMAAKNFLEQRDVADAPQNRQYSLRGHGRGAEVVQTRFRAVQAYQHLGMMAKNRLGKAGSN